MAYVSLHNHTSFSVMDSLIRPIDLFKRAKELGQPAIAVTDHGTFAGMWDSLKASKETGVKLIAGCEFYFVDDVSDQEARIRHVILLAKNAIGYKNLLKLNKFGYDNSIIAFKKVIPRIDWKLLEAHSEGVICTTACAGGILGYFLNANQYDEAKSQALRLKSIFGDDFAIEVQPNALRRYENLHAYAADQASTNHRLIKLAKEIDVKVIAATNAHYLTKDQAEDHDVLLSIGSGQPIYSGNRLKYNVPDFYVKSEEEVIAFFSRLYGQEFAEELCKNTIYFADKCEFPEWIDPKFSNPSGKELPIFPVKDQGDYEEFKNWVDENYKNSNLEDDVLYLRFSCEKNFVLKVPTDQYDEYKKRLSEELDVLEYHGFSSYMLIVADYIDYCRKNNIPVGPGRGSVGGSLVAYLLGIHMADPIKYKLIFARFHNKEKTSFPDIDTDISSEGREKLQDYIRKKYGNDYVAHVSNVNTITPKVYARDLARAFEFGGDRKTAVEIGTNIADSIPAEIKKIKNAFTDSPLFAEYAKIYPELAKFAVTISGKARAWSTHAGGILIGRRPLLGLVPLRKDKEGAVVIEYEKERAEENGLVKMDTLGLETLDIIHNTYKLIEASGKPMPPNPPNFDEYDEKTYDLISRGDTLCVFQFGTSAGTIELCKQIKPKNIEDLSIITSLARPSAKEIREQFIKTRNGELPVNIMHPSLKRAFEDTYGFGLYEECLMYLAQDVAGWDLHSADRLRKLTKEKGKNPERVKKWREEFIEDAKKNRNIDKSIASKIWDEVIEGFGGYGFNHSHAVLYSMISYHTAYLKAHYPLEFLTANLMSEVSSNAKTAKDNIEAIKNEIRKYNVNILPPDLNKSDLTYKIIDDNTLMTGLDALKFMGKDAIPEIIAKRPFSSFEDLLIRTDAKKVRAPAVQALAAAGCLDSFGLSRRAMFLYASDYRKKLQVWLKKAPDKRGEFIYPWPEDYEVDWSISEKFALEKEYLGEGLSGTIQDRYPNFFVKDSLTFDLLPELHPAPKTHPNKKPKAKIKNDPDDFEPKLFGIVRSVFKFKVKKAESKLLGQTMARLQVADVKGNEISVVVFPDALEDAERRIKVLSSNKEKEFVPGMALHFNGYANWYEGSQSIIFNKLINLKLTPSLPIDLKAKKVSMPRTSKKIKKDEVTDKDDLLESIEDELINDGLISEDDFDELSEDAF